MFLFSVSNDPPILISILSLKIFLLFCIHLLLLWIVWQAPNWLTHLLTKDASLYDCTNIIFQCVYISSIDPFIKLI